MHGDVLQILGKTFVDVHQDWGLADGAYSGIQSSLSFFLPLWYFDTSLKFYDNLYILFIQNWIPTRYQETAVEPGTGDRTFLCIEIRIFLSECKQISQSFYDSCVVWSTTMKSSLFHLHMIIGGTGSKIRAFLTRTERRLTQNNMPVPKRALE